MHRLPHEPIIPQSAWDDDDNDDDDAFLHLRHRVSLSLRLLSISLLLHVRVSAHVKTDRRRMQLIRWREMVKGREGDPVWQRCRLFPFK